MRARGDFALHTLRRTKRALDRFRLDPNEDQVGEPDTLLGDWYANLFNVGPKRWVFCLSQRSLLAVVVPAGQEDFPSGLVPAVADVLARVGVDDSACQRELDATTEHAVGRTRRRSVLGVMTDLVLSAELSLRDGMRPIELSVWLSRTPIKPLAYGSPAEVTLDLFASSRMPS